MQPTKNGKRPFLQRGGVLFLLLFLANMAWAEETDSLRHYNLDTIVVSSIKHTNNKLAISSSTITANVMARQQLNEIKDFTSVIPNFVMIDRDSRLTSSVFVRGVGSLIGTPGVAMYVDGIPHFEKSTFDISLADVDRIEFLRGSQGTLYGRNAQGGIILVHTRSPFKHQGSTLNLRYGKFNETAVSFSHLNTLGERFGFGLSGTFNHTDGFIQNRFLNQKADKMDDYAFNARAEWRAADNFVVKLVNSYQHTKQGAFAYGTADAEKQTVDSVSMNRSGYYHRNLYDGGLQMDYWNNSIWLRSNTSVQLLKDKYGVDQDGSPRDAVFVVQNDKHRLLSQEFTLRPIQENRYRWHFGLFGFSQLIDRDVNVNFFLPKESLSVKKYNNLAQGFALYHQSAFDITSKLTVEAGIRYDWEKISSDFDSFLNDKLLKELSQPLTFTNFTPKVSLQYNFNANNSLYASASKGYKAGGFNTSFDLDKVEQFNYGDERSWMYETGVKLATPSRNFAAEVALFYIDITNPQVKRNLAVGNRIVNAGKSNSKGVEVTLTGKPSKNLSITAVYGYTDAKFTDYILQEKTAQKEEINATGNYVPYVPRHTFSVSADYVVPVKSALSDQIGFHASYKGVGNMFWDELNKAQQKYYGLLDANISVKKGKTSFSVWGKNLTNAEYLGYYFTMGPKGMAKPGKPLTAGVSLTLNF